MFFNRRNPEIKKVLFAYLAKGLALFAYCMLRMC